MAHFKTTVNKGLVMKKLLTRTILIVLILSPLLCYASFIIYLKDGSQIFVDTYWEEEDTIQAKKYGGMIGISSARVSRIEEVKSETPPEVKGISGENPGLTQKKKSQSAKGEGAENEKKAAANEHQELEKKENAGDAKKVKEQGTPAEMSEEEKKNAEWEKIAKTQKLLEEKRQIMREKESVITSYKEAKARKNMEKKKQYWNELLSLQKKLGNLRERAVAENGGGLPDWWDDAR